MPGAVDIDPNKIRDVSAIAKKVGERQNGSPIYQWGPDAPEPNGQIAPNSEAVRRRKYRQNVNAVKQIMRADDVDESTAREKAKEFNQKRKEIENDPELTKDERKRELRDIRRDTFGSA